MVHLPHLAYPGIPRLALHSSVKRVARRLRMSACRYEWKIPRLDEYAELTGTDRVEAVRAIRNMAHSCPFA